MDPKYLWLSNGERVELPQRSVDFSGHSAQFVRILRTRRNSLKEYFSKKSIVGRPSSAIAM
ncbi:MAG: hypothetical protein WBW37_10570, partial [Methyloceanibacter sp.]